MKKYRFNPKKFKRFLMISFGYMSFTTGVFIFSLYFYTHLDLFTTIPAYKELGRALREYWIF
jgi:hypothetical protein